MLFEDFLKRISPTLKRITYRLGARLLFCSNEDLYQEALVHLWQDFNSGKIDGKTDSYVLQGCYFYLKNYIRKINRRAKVISLDTRINEEGQGATLDDIIPCQKQESSLDVINCQMLVEIIKNNGLTDREKEIFSLALQGLTTREIGNRLGISHVRVVKLKSRIKDKCNKYIDWI